MVRAAPGPLAPGHYDETVLPYVRGLETIASIDGELVCNIDSSDMTPALWERLGGLVAAHIDAGDGIVILHGTDTMAWSAAALALMLLGLP
ncbi:MAG: asparaginase domain-containing protein, partial [bacterium]